MKKVSTIIACAVLAARLDMKNHLLSLTAFAISLLMASCTNTSEIQFVDGVTEALNNGGKVNKEVIHRYNALSPADYKGRLDILKNLLGNIADDEIIINQPFYCDYGKQISVGKRFFANFHFTVLDEAKITIGDDCFIGPNVSIYTACHSTDPIERNTSNEWAEPVTIGNNVTKDIPSDVVAVGIRKILQEDRRNVA